MQLKLGCRCLYPLLSHGILKNIFVLQRKGRLGCKDALFFCLTPSKMCFGMQGPSEVEVSDMCEGRKMNVAHGLAWSFYLGYLQLVLPRQ